jgi:hypothetical protein
MASSVVLVVCQKLVNLFLANMRVPLKVDDITTLGKISTGGFVHHRLIIQLLLLLLNVANFSC